jgi:pimeloyl-ACP methyl ester carboxylesterase
MGLADWQGNFDRHPTDDDKDKLSEFDLKLVGSIKPGRHRGFAKGWGGVRDKVEAWIASLPASPRSFVFSGHSLGGALALLGAYEFASVRSRNVAAVVTFGAVMPGRKDFAEDYERLLGKRTIRLESHEDAVPKSLSLLGYVPVGRQWIVDKRPLASWWRMLFVKNAVNASSASAGSANNAHGVAQAAASTPSTSVPKSPDDDKYWNLRIGGWSTRIDKSQSLAQKALAVLAFLLFVLLLKLLWLAVKGSIRAYRGHSMEKRYALYLTTLSYRRLRALRGTRDEDYERAYADLKSHLAYVRGSNDQFYRGVLKRPAKVKSVRDATRTREAYSNYIS